MNQDNTVVASFASHSTVDEAVKELNRNGFDMTHLSVIGKGYHTEENAVGFYTIGDRIRSWGATGAFWGGIWGLLLAPAVFLLPGIGIVGLAGPVVAAVISALEGAAIGGGISALGTALVQLGVSKDEAVKYETVIKTNGFVLVAHGTSEEVERARVILNRSTPPNDAPGS